MILCGNENIVMYTLMLSATENKDVFEKALVMLQENNLDLHSSVIELVYKLVRTFEMSQKFLETFLGGCCKTLQKLKTKPNINTQVRMLAGLMKKVIMEKHFDPKPQIGQWRLFCQEFIVIPSAKETIQELSKLIEKK